MPRWDRRASQAARRVVREMNLTGQLARIGQGLIQGGLMKEIAADLGVSLSTVKSTTRYRLYPKAGVSNRQEFQARAFCILARLAKGRDEGDSEPLT